MAQLEKIGVQLFTIRDFMNNEEDIKRSFEKLKNLGYDEVQTAGCVCPYDTFGKLAEDAGLEIVGTHEDFDKIIADPETAIRNNKALNTKIIGIGGWWEETKEGYEAFIDKFNNFASLITKEGFTFSYHNHSHEFIKLKSGELPFELLVEKLDPVKTNFVLDTYWIQHGGADVRHWIEKLAGRIKIIHLKDMSKDNGPGQFITEIGNGNLYWEGIIETSLRTGVQHFVVEQDNCPGNPFDSLKISSDYLHANFF